MEIYYKTIFMCAHLESSFSPGIDVTGILKKCRAIGLIKCWKFRSIFFSLLLTDVYGQPPFSAFSANYFLQNLWHETQDDTNKCLVSSFRKNFWSRGLVSTVKILMVKAIVSVHQGGYCIGKV